MGAQSILKPLTVEEYEKIPDPPGGRYELHHGELVFVTYPVHQHKALQRRLRKLLEPMAEPRGFIVDTEYPYRPLPSTPSPRGVSRRIEQCSEQCRYRL